MNHFERHDGRLFAEDVALSQLAATYGTPLYVYSRATLVRHVKVWREALSGLDALICYAVKANSNLAILHLLAKEQLGFDIVSGGELARVQRAGGSAERTVFSGVGKAREEMEAALAAGVLMFNVESAAELEQLAAIASAAGKRAPISIRVNPEVDAKTHPYIATGLKQSKFGVPFGDARALYERARALPSLEVVGIDCHIGSQILSLDPFREALHRVLELAAELRNAGFALSLFDAGGGLGAPYAEEQPPDPAAYGALLRKMLGDTGYRVVLEPGRVLMANAGVLLTRVRLLKHSNGKTFAVVDAAMNDLIRPALYQAFHAIEVDEERAPEARFDIVGPVCESSDFLAKDRLLPDLRENDLLMIRGAGAYGFSMASQYNSRPRAAEVLVDGASARIIRARETHEDLWRGETIS